MDIAKALTKGRAPIAVMASAITAVITAHILRDRDAPYITILALSLVSSGLVFFSARLLGVWLEARTREQFWYYAERGLLFFVVLAILVLSGFFVYPARYRNFEEMILALLVVGAAIAAFGLIKARTIGFWIFAVGLMQIIAYFFFDVSLFLVCGAIALLVSAIGFINPPVASNTAVAHRDP